ncbi:hypothetical protein ACIGXM_11270 [Kitasatospora sp. NPDC052896]|uniref:hypothetical protein n=1 Tax=Kitasatospora sp. NPDC052896 TaxID=3364061 RepID=UPI0037CA6E2C
MTRSSGQLRRALLWTVLTACVLTAAPTADATVPTDGRAAAKKSRVYVAHIDPDPVPAGGNLTVRVLLVNEGPNATGNSFTVSVTLPQNVVATGRFFPAGCLSNLTGTSVTCAFPSGLGNQRTAAVLVPARVSPTVPAHSKLSGGMATVTNPDDPDAKVRTVTFGIRVA